jgi:hypothetical protein
MVKKERMELLVMVHHLAVGIGSDGLLLDPGQVALALFGLHGAAYLEALLEHLPLALGAKPGYFLESALYFGSNLFSAGEKMLQVHVLFIDLAAALGASGHVSLMQGADALEFGVAQMKLHFEPGQLRGGAVHHFAAAGGAGIVKAGIGGSAQQKAEAED